MCDEYMPVLQFNVTLDEFHRLPRNSAYKYEYLGGEAILSPRPKHFHGRLDLTNLHLISDGCLPRETTLRPAQASDQDELVTLFSAAFWAIQPFGSLNDEQRADAAKKCLDKTFTGGDGPMIWSASFVAVDEIHHHPRGAILVTLLPEGDPSSWNGLYWDEEPPPDCIAKRLGQPHLTWIIVSPWFKGEGLGSFLLTASVKALREMGFTHLLSTFLLGNDSTLLWHWRNGFQLLPFPGSKRQWRKQWAELREEK